MTNEGHAVKSTRRLRLAFLVSCAINLVMAGTFVGALLHGREQHEAPRHHAPEASMLIGGAVFRGLDRPERMALRELARGEYPDILARRRAEAETLLELIRMPTLDAEALRAAIAVQHERLSSIHSAMQDVWIEKVASMSQDERIRLADQVHNHLRHPPRP